MQSEDCSETGAAAEAVARDSNRYDTEPSTATDDYDDESESETDSQMAVSGSEEQTEHEVDMCEATSVIATVSADN